MIVGYRGYGPSEGTPSEPGIMLDSEAIVDYIFTDLKDVINTKNIYMMGRSLGGAVGLYILTKTTNKAYILKLNNYY